MAVTQAHVDEAQNKWAAGLIRIAKAFANKEDYKAVATDFIYDLYDYKEGEVLFKPTLASKTMFRPTFEGALSYFVGGNPKFEEDGGFAIKPWETMKFDNAGYITGEDHGVVMGNKIIHDTGGNLTTANYTMVFKPRNGQLKIVLHHSSLPFTG